MELLRRVPSCPKTQPPAIPIRAGACYFAIDSKSQLYDRMLQAQSVTIYAPAGIPDMQLDLIAVTG